MPRATLRPRFDQPSPVLLQIETFLGSLAPERPLLVAFSGGADSTALLWALATCAPRHRIPVVAAHFDHGLDADSARRAQRAAEIAAQIGVPLVVGRDSRKDAGWSGPVPSDRAAREGAEAAARAARYRFLESERLRLGAQCVVTAHHRDDQAETVILRLLFGSGILGLAGIRPMHGWLRRPLLGVPRCELAEAAAAAGCIWIADPTNDRADVPRNRVRHRLLPRLEAAPGRLATSLAAVATAAAAAQTRIDGILTQHLVVRSETHGASCAAAPFAALRAELQPLALNLLHRVAGARWPARSRAQSAWLAGLRHGLTEQAAGAGWRWRLGSERLILERHQPTRSAPPPFTYTFVVPGSCVVPELGVRVTVTRVAVEDWMWKGAATRAALDLPLAESGLIEVRNRRPGDRLRPLGGAGTRRLKEILVDRKVPRAERGRLPLLCCGGRIAWVPGLTIAHEFRLPTGASHAWLARLDAEHEGFSESGISEPESLL